MSKCHGCGGRGWVSPSYGVAVKCPICGGTGEAQKLAPKVTKEVETNIPPAGNFPLGPYIGDVPMGTPFKVKGKCPNAGNPCFCTGACMEPQFPQDFFFRSEGWLRPDIPPKSQSDVDTSKEENK